MDEVKDLIKIGSRVKYKNSDVEGIVTVIHNGAARLKIIKGNTAVTDYYVDDLEIVEPEA